MRKMNPDDQRKRLSRYQIPWSFSVFKMAWVDDPEWWLFARGELVRPMWTHYGYQIYEELGREERT